MRLDHCPHCSYDAIGQPAQETGLDRSRNLGAIRHSQRPQRCFSHGLPPLGYSRPLQMLITSIVQSIGAGWETRDWPVQSSSPNGACQLLRDGQDGLHHMRRGRREGAREHVADGWSHPKKIDRRSGNCMMEARLLTLPDLMAVKMTLTPEGGTNEEEELTHGRPKAKWTLSPRHRGAQRE